MITPGKEQTAAQLREILSAHAPDKADRIPGLLVKYAGKEIELLANVRQKYGIAERVCETPDSLVDLRRRIQDGDRDPAARLRDLEEHFEAQIRGIKGNVNLKRRPRVKVPEPSAQISMKYRLHIYQKFISSLEYAPLP